MINLKDSTGRTVVIKVSTLQDRPKGSTDLGVVYATVEGFNDHSFDECLAVLLHKAHGLGATALVGMQLVQSQHQDHQRTSLIATAVRSEESKENLDIC